MKFEFNLPNVLTLMRFALVPVIGVCLFVDKPGALLAALIVFGVSALTDALDGALARKMGLTSEFGAYLDPLADKILVSSVFVLLAFKPGLYVHWALVALIVARDVLVTRLRNLALKKHIQFKTSTAAKAKTAAQMISIALILIYVYAVRYFGTRAGIVSVSYAETLRALKVWPGLAYLPLALTSLVTLFTIYTAIDYAAAYGKKIREIKNG